MRYSLWIFAIVMPVALFLIYCVASPVWVQADDEINPGDAVSANRLFLAQESPMPDSATSGATPEPTRSHRPTPTPVPVPPPSNPNTTQMLVISGIMVVVVVIFGLVLNRNRVF